MNRKVPVSKTVTKISSAVKKIGGGIGKVTDTIKRHAVYSVQGRNFKGEKLERIGRRRYRVVKE